MEVKAEQETTLNNQPESPEKGQTETSNYGSRSEFNFIDEDMNVSIRKKKSGTISFDNLPQRAAELTMTIIKRFERKAINELKVNVTSDELTNYYMLLLAHRLKTVLDANALTEDKDILFFLTTHFTPKGASPKYLNMFDLYQVILGQIGVVKLAEPSITIVPILTVSKVKAAIKALTVDDINRISDELAFIGESVNFQISRGIPREPDGQDDFMKVCVINDTINSVSRDVNPETISLVAISGHEVKSNDVNNLVFSYDHGPIADYFEMVKANVIGRK